MVTHVFNFYLYFNNFQFIYWKGKVNNKNNIDIGVHA